MVHLGQDAVDSAGVGIHDLTAQQVIDKITALGQTSVRLGKVVGAAHLSACSVHIGYISQAQQDDIALGAHAEDAALPCAVGGSVQSLELGQEFCAVTQRQGFHFATHAVGGYDLAGGKIALHGMILLTRIKKHFTRRQSALKVLVDLNDDFFALADSSGTHNNADCLCDTSLLADDAAHIGLSHFEVIDGSAVITHGVNGHLHSLLVFDKAAGNG